jgi:hypothetical protein
MKLTLSSVVFLVCLLAVPAIAQDAQPVQHEPAQAKPVPPVKAAGGWKCFIDIDSYEAVVTLSIFQKDARLWGSVSGETGEFELNGNVVGNQVTVSWNQPYGGRLLPYTLTGELKGEVLEGPADLSLRGKWWFKARRFME